MNPEENRSKSLRRRVSWPRPTQLEIANMRAPLSRAITEELDDDFDHGPLNRIDGELAVVPTVGLEHRKVPRRTRLVGAIAPILLIAALPVVLWAIPLGSDPEPGGLAGTTPDPSAASTVPIQTPSSDDAEKLEVVTATWTVTPLAGRYTPDLGHDGHNFILIDAGTAYLSPDGIRWEQRGLIHEDLAAHAVASDGSTIVVFGALVDTSRIDTDGVTHHKASWVSHDRGQTWTRTGFDTFDRWGQELISTPIGFVAVGQIVLDGASYLERATHGVVWMSHDGLNWEQTAVTGEPGRQSSVALSVVWNDRLEMFGYQGRSREPEESGEPLPNLDKGMVWSSTDGHIWSVDQELSWFPWKTVLSNHGQASNVRFGPQQGIWTQSADRQWSLTLPATDRVEFQAIAGSASGTYVLGRSGGTMTLWHTADGLTWTRVSLPDLQEDLHIYVLEAHEDIVVIGVLDADGEPIVAAGTIDR